MNVPPTAADARAREGPAAPAPDASSAPTRDAAQAPVRDAASARGPQRRVLWSVLLLIAALAIHLFASRPLALRHAQLEREAAARHAQLVSMQQAAWQLRALAPRADRGQHDSALAIVERSARAASVAIARMQPEGEHAVRISVDRIGFDALIAWLAELESGHGLRARALRLERLDTPGLAAGEVLLGSGPARPREERAR